MSFPAWMVEIEKGKVPGHQLLTISAHHFSVGSSYSDVWEAPVASTRAYLEAAEPMLLASTSASDSFGGAGLQTVDIVGLDNDWNIISESVNLAGLTPVETSKSYRHILQAEGYLGNSLGLITFTAKTSGTPQAYMQAAHNKCMGSHWCTPAGYLAIIILEAPSAGVGKEVEIHCETWDDTRPNSSHIAARVIHIVENASRQSDSLVVPERHCFKMKAKSPSTGGAYLSVAYHIILIEKGAAGKPYIADDVFYPSRYKLR